MVDKGDKANIPLLIEQMNKKAKLAVEEAEREKRRMQTQLEVTSSIDTTSMMELRTKKLGKKATLLSNIEDANKSQQTEKVP